MSEANKKNHCLKNEAGEINLYQTFHMDPPAKGSIADYQIDFSAECEPSLILNVEAYCFFE